MQRIHWLATGLFAAALVAAAVPQVRVYSVAKKGFITVDKVIKTDEEWRKLLTPEQFEITRQRGTERSCSGAFWNYHQAGVYKCVCCGNDLFQSVKKFDSKTGWLHFLE